MVKNKLDYLWGFLPSLLMSTADIFLKASININIFLTSKMPQGTLLGSLLFAIYIIGLALLLEEHGMKYHLCVHDI